MSFFAIHICIDEEISIELFNTLNRGGTEAGRK